MTFTSQMFWRRKKYTFQIQVMYVTICNQIIQTLKMYQEEGDKIDLKRESGIMKNKIEWTRKYILAINGELVTDICMCICTNVDDIKKILILKTRK